MASNTNPIYASTPNIGFGVVSAANTAYDGTGTVTTIFTAGATNGSYVSKIRCLCQGTSAATVAKFFLNNGGANTTASNNVFLFDFSLPATTASNTSALVCYEIPIYQELSAGYKINVCLGTATGSANWAFTTFGANYLAASSANPVFPLTPSIGFNVISAANTAMDGTGTVATIFSAGPNGSLLSKCRIVPAGQSAQTVLRLFLNNGSANTTASNNSLIYDYSLPQTVSNIAGSNVYPNPSFEIPFNFNLPANWTIIATLGTATGSANWALTCFGANY